MKRYIIALLANLAVLILCVNGTLAAAQFDNGDFESDQGPRAKYQGWEDEYILGWKPFAGQSWLENGKEHVGVVNSFDVAGGHYLRLVGIDNGYVGVRSIHIPVNAMGIYTVSAEAFIKELADPSRCQVWLEFWPKNPEGETSTFRLKYSRATAKSVGNWVNLEVSDTAPADAATATVLVIIHKSGKAPLLPAEVYVDNVTFSESK